MDSIEKQQSLDALLPPAMAVKAEDVGVAKAGRDALGTLALGVLAGAFIALGAVFATVASVGSADAIGFGAARVLAGTVFSLGLILVVVGGAELFTGNNLIVMAWASRKVSTKRLLRNWGLVYLGNFIGSFGTAVMVHLSGHAAFGGGEVGLALISLAQAKSQYHPVNAVFLGVLGNALVCLAVWLSFSARSAADKVLVIVPPIAAFVAVGFEHVIANMYYFSIATLTLYASPDAFWSAVDAAPSDYPDLRAADALLNNLLPVTLGNIIGGAGLVGAVYWFVYLRNRKD